MAEAEKKDAKDGAKEGAAPAPAKSGTNTILIVIVAIAALILAIGIPVAIFMAKRTAPEATAELPANAAQNAEAALVPEGTGAEEEISEGEEPLGAILPLDTFVVNLSGGRYIRCQIQIEFNSRDIPKKYYPRTVPIRDSILSLLASKSADDLGSEKGKEQLRTEVKDIIDETLKKEEVKKVYFTQFVIQ